MQYNYELKIENNKASLNEEIIIPQGSNNLIFKIDDSIYLKKVTAKIIGENKNIDCDIIFNNIKIPIELYKSDLLEITIYNENSGLVLTPLRVNIIDMNLKNSIMNITDLYKDFKFKLDLEKIEVVQNDETNKPMVIFQNDLVKLECDIVWNDKPKDLTGLVLNLVAKRENDSKYIRQTIDITQGEILGNIIILLSKYITKEVGRYKAQIELINNSGRVHTQPFAFEVVKCLSEGEECDDGDNTPLPSTLTIGENTICNENLILSESGQVYSLTADGLPEWINGVTPLNEINMNKINEGITRKVDKIEGKGLSTEDYTTAEKNKLDGLNNYNDTLIRLQLETITQRVTDIENSGTGGSGLILRDVDDGEIFILGNAPTVIYGQIVLSKTSTTIVEGKTDTFTVKLDKAPTNNQVVSLSKNNNDVTLNQTSLTFTPQNWNIAQNVTITTAEDDNDYSNETCTITLSSSNVTSKTVIVNITDNDEPSSNIPVKSVSISPKTCTLEVGETVQLTATITPSDATNKQVSYNSNNSNCTVTSSGLVTSVSEGVSIITCTTVDGNKTDTCNITVQANQTPSDGYVTENLDIMYDLTQYEDGYMGDVLDTVNNIKAIITGQENYTTGRNGFVGGKFMSNFHKTGNYSTFTIPTRESYNNYPFTIELYTSLRDNYNAYLPDGILELNGEQKESFSPIISTREGGTTGNGYYITADFYNKMSINGSTSTPLIENIESNVTVEYLKGSVVDYHHIVVVLGSDFQRLYVDGTKVLEASNKAVALNNGDRELKILSYAYSVVRGDLKLVRVYNSALTDVQALQNYNDVIKTMGGNN